MPTEVLKIDPRRPDPAVLARAADALRRGDLVAFPTETFYGLGAAALDTAAVRRVFDVKGRPESRPLLVLVDSVLMVERLAANISITARQLMARHWPGALTLVIPAATTVPRELSAGTATIGVRLSSHPVATGLVTALGGPVTAPSANVSDEAPPTTVADVLAYFGDTIALVLDGGPTAGGPPSTVLDVTVEPPRVIRAGAVKV
ncbi:MAG: threonylcarbamoyl-AMP synthase [Candidatus Rokuibacteriota bacterium]|nr:MAG: threonylcarbamoyl-AMP synthase [Candidatus Rokubacteria bacterium]